MKMIKTTMCSSIILTSAILATTTVSAATSANETMPATQSPAAPYGDNPNIFKVLGHKAQQAAKNTAEIVDQAAQKGIAKVQPQVATAWQQSKEFASEKSGVAKEKSQQAAASVNKKINQTKDDWIGSPNQQSAPIESLPLSQSSTNQPSSESHTAPTQIPTRKTAPL